MKNKRNVIVALGVALLCMNSSCDLAEKNLSASQNSVLAETNSQPTEWKGSIAKDEDDIWLNLIKDGKALYDFRIGTTGVIGEMRDKTNFNKALLSPSVTTEVTDRVIQWTIWSINFNITNSNYIGTEVGGARYNVTQAGTGANVLNKTLSVEISKTKSQVDVYGKADIQWDIQNQGVMSGVHTMLTRYSFDKRGFLKVYRVVSVGEPKLRGVTQEWKDFYFEAWTPMKGGSNVFTGLALSLDDKGVPNYYYEFNNNIPGYPVFPATSLSGYAVTYNKEDMNKKTAVGIVYGTKNVISSNADDLSALNTMAWDTGIGILPAIYARGITPARSIVVQTLYIVPRVGLSADMKRLLATLAEEIPAPRIYHPNEIPAGTEIAAIYAKLMANENATGTATDNLGSLSVVIE